MMATRWKKRVGDEEEETPEDGLSEVVADVIIDPATGKKKRVGTRGISWKGKEDECSVDFWKAVSLDPITGSNQTSDSYWKMIKTEFD